MNSEDNNDEPEIQVTSIAKILRYQTEFTQARNGIHSGYRENPGHSEMLPNPPVSAVAGQIDHTQEEGSAQHTLPSFLMSWQKADIHLGEIKYFAYTGEGLSPQQETYLRSDKTGRRTLAQMRAGLWHPEDTAMYLLVFCKSESAVVAKIIQEVEERFPYIQLEQKRTVSECFDTIFKLLERAKYIELGLEQFPEEEVLVRQHIDVDRCAVCRTQIENTLRSLVIRSVLAFTAESQALQSSWFSTTLDLTEATAVITLDIFAAEEEAEQIGSSQIQLHFRTESEKGSLSRISRAYTDALTLQVRSNRSEYIGLLLRVSLVSPTGVELTARYMPMEALVSQENACVAEGSLCLGELQDIRTTIGSEWAVLLQPIYYEEIPVQERSCAEEDERWHSAQVRKGPDWKQRYSIDRSSQEAFLK